MICPYCKNQAEFLDNKEIYGKRYGNSYMMWICRHCDARVGVHHNNHAHPLGTMANKELREWRMKAHTAVDPLWKSGKISRREVYRGLDKLFGKEFHIGSSNIQECQKIISVYKQYDK